MLTFSLPSPRRRSILARLPLLLVLLSGVAQAAQPPLSPVAILRRALDLSEEVNDYTATLQVSADFRAAPQEIPAFKVYFKRPDKVHIESRSFVVVRRDMLTFGNLARYVEQGAQVTLAGSKTVAGTPIYALKLIPKEEHTAPPPPPPDDPDDPRPRPRRSVAASGAPRVLVTVNGRRWTVERMEFFEGSRSTATMNWTYALIGNRHWMPSRIDCAMPTVAKRDGTPGARLVVSFSNYRVNTGLSDALFVQPQTQGRRAQ